ncbi:MAG: ATP-binding protein [Planctomycetaceae bacterium]
MISRTVPASETHPDNPPMGSLFSELLLLGARVDFQDFVLAALLLLGVAIGLLALVVSNWKNGATRRLLRRMFGRNYRERPVVSRSFSKLDLPNVRRAIEAYVQQHGAELMVRSVGGRVNLADSGLTDTGESYVQVDIDVDEREDCLMNAVWLVRGPGIVRAILTAGHASLMEVMAPTREEAGECLQELRRLIRQHSVYRGRVISIEARSCGDDYESVTATGGTHVRFHRLPPVASDAIVLPEDTMKRIKRNTVGFFQKVDRLKQHGFSARRGLLFHGPPGTGKTRTACWLTHSLPGVTVFLVTGEQLWNIRESCQLARELAPAMLILEDVDLIATRRDASFQTTALHQLMNEMDGLDSASELLFLLTTNQPDQIEQALANRPGRIDQAIHFPLPDDQCRQRLVELYSNQSTLQISDWPTLLKRTSGASPAFIKELVRKAAMISVESSDEPSDALVLNDEHFREACAEMTSGDGSITRRLTGFAAPPV